MRLRAFAVMLVCLGVFVLERPLFAATFYHEERHYHLTYDEARYALVTPGMLSTDLVLRRLSGEGGFFPNITIKSVPATSGNTVLRDAATSVMDYYLKALPSAEIVKQSPVEWKGYPAHLIDVHYTRGTDDLYLRTLLVETPRLLFTINLTSPYATRAENIAALMAIVTSLSVDPS